MTTNGSQQIQPQSLDEWVELLRVEEMPIFSSTAQNLYLSLDDRSKGAMDLAGIILQDPNLTAKVLKIGNSTYYNPSRHKISTVSRAIMMLGVQNIRELTLVCSFVESVLSSRNRQRANQEIARAIHSAVQARELAVSLHDPLPEEVFIAALLHNIGRICFWCASGSAIEQVHRQLSRVPGETDAAIKKLMGFSLQDLSKKLCKVWHLSGLVAEAIQQPKSADNRIRNVLLGETISNALQAGWQSAEMIECLRQLQQLTNHSAAEIRSKIQLATAKAADIAHQFGAREASQLISPKLESEDTAAYDPLAGETIDPKQLQFQILQEITTHISGDIDLNVLFELVLEGIHRCLNMDRTILMLLSSDKKCLQEKIALDVTEQSHQDKLRIDNAENGNNLFFHALNQREACWAKPHQFADLYTPAIANRFGTHECFIFPIEVQNKAIGLLYCDRATNGRAFTVDEFAVANHFVKQAHIGLTLYRIKQA